MTKVRATLFGTDAPPPVVTTNLGYTFLNGGLDGFVTSNFQGYDPAVVGQLTVAIGYTAYETPGVVAQAAPLAHVQAATPVADATSLVDLAFTTPGSTFGFGSEAPGQTDIGISATTPGLSGVLGPLNLALTGTTLGSELAPILHFAKGLLPGLDRNGGAPGGGISGARPAFAVSAGVGLSHTLTVLGQPFVTSQTGSLVLRGQAGAQAGAALTDAATLLSDGATLLTDVQAGNLPGSVQAGITALGAAGALGTAVLPLLAAASQQHNPALPPIANPSLDLNLQSQTGQSFSLGLADPTSLTETLGVHITADTFGAYALGKLLAQVAPQLITDLQAQGSVQQPLDVLSQLANGASALANDAAQGFTGVGNAGSVPSSNHADISIQLTLGITEAQTTVGGAVSNTQTFSTDLQSNAQGFYDLATAAQPAITDLLLGLLQTPSGHEILQIGGTILSQLDQKLGGSAALPHETGPAVTNFLHSWHHA